MDSQSESSSKSDTDNNNDNKIAVEQSSENEQKKTLAQKIISKSEMLQNLEGDKLHVVILLFLYCLQGIPLGLRDAIPLMLTRKNVPYTDQAKYSISAYPFAMKVLWAPIIDSVFSTRFGRRKSWLVPVQYLLG